MMLRYLIHPIFLIYAAMVGVSIARELWAVTALGCICIVLDFTNWRLNFKKGTTWPETLIAAKNAGEKNIPKPKPDGPTPDKRIPIGATDV